MAIYSLIVGINEYLGNVPNLGGCHNDAERFANVLKTRFQVEDNKQLMLLSKEATRANIIKGFQEHLAQASAGDMAVFYYSGHGSQEQAPPRFWHSEADRQNETLVCHDSRAGAGDLADKEIRFLISEVAKKQAKIIVLMDCCHSGNGTRFVGANVERLSDVRLTKQSNQSRTAEDYVFFEQAQQAGWLEDIGQMPEGDHIVLSACRDSELSKELIIRGKRQGAFTHHLCQTLENTEVSLSYRNLLRKVRLQVRNLVAKQNPIATSIGDAEIDEIFLGEAIQPLRLAVFFKDSRWWLDAGVIHAMNKGDEIAIYANTEKQQLGAESLVNATLAEVQTEKSLLTFEAEAGRLLSPMNGYYARVLQQVMPRLAIALNGMDVDVMLLQSTVETLANGEPSALLKVVEQAACEYQIVVEQGQYGIMRAGEAHWMFEPLSGADAAKKVLQQAEHLARWHNKLSLMNSASRIPDDVVRLVIKHEGDESDNKEINLTYRQQHGEWIPPEFSVELRFNDESEYEKPLFCSLLIFNPFDASVDMAMDHGVWLRPSTYFDSDAGSLNKIHAATSYAVFDGEFVTAQVDDALFNQGITQTQDIFKLIVSETPFNAALLMQEGLETYQPELDASSKGDHLQSMLDESFQYAHTRKIVRKSKKQPDWLSMSTTINTHRPLEAISLSGSKNADLGNGVEVEAHDLQALVSLQSTQVAGRSADSNVGKMTPACFDAGGESSTFTFSNGRSVDGGLDCLVIQANSDAELNEKLSASTPLNVGIGKHIADNEMILPYVSDGEYFYPVGYSENTDQQTVIRIEGVPEMAEQVDVQSKGLGKSLKVFFQKVAYDQLRLKNNTLRQLSVIEFKPDTAVAEDSENKLWQAEKQPLETDIIKAKVADAERILLLVHGIAGDTDAMLDCLTLQNEDGDSLRANYDLVLGFDYESLNTSVQETARILKQQLQALGLDKEHGKQLDVVAIDLGGLMIRWMIEEEDCDDGRINQLVLVGVPNAGTPWASLKEQGMTVFKGWAYGSLTLMLNNLTVVPVGSVAVAGMMKLLNAVDNTLDQMAETSELLGSLSSNASTATKYFSIIGNTENLMIELNGTDKSGFARIFEYLMKRSKLAVFDFLTEKLFKQANDFAFSQESMKALPAGFDEEQNGIILACDHFSYFHDATVVNKMISVLK